MQTVQLVDAGSVIKELLPVLTKKRENLNKKVELKGR